MRGPDQRSDFLFSYLSPEQRVPADHPLRPIRRIVDAALARLSSRFDALYSDFGRPSIPPEQLLRAMLVQVFYTVRSERLLVEQLEYNLLFRSVRRPRSRRADLGSFDVFDQSGSAAAR